MLLTDYEMISLDKLAVLKKLPPEVEEGNIEYKLRIDHKERQRLVELSTQMCWRFSEDKVLTGIPHAYYYIGVQDDGTIGNIDMKVIKESHKNFKKVVELADAKIESTKITKLPEGCVALIKVCPKPDEYGTPEVRTVLLGNTGVGKTSIIGTLTYGIKDDGNGKSRYNIFRYRHEHNSGKTSSIKYEISGFIEDKFINYSEYPDEIWENIYSRSDTIINFVDVPGDLRFLKTTLFGVMSYRPHFITIVLDAKEMSENFDAISIDELFDIDGRKGNPLEYYLHNNLKLHLDICTKLEIPTLISINKTDSISKDTTISINNYVSEYLTKCKVENDIVTHENVSVIKSFDKVYIIPISCVTHQGLDLYTILLNTLVTKFSDPSMDKKIVSKEFMVNDNVYIPDVGTVLSGIMNQGTLSIKDNVLIGPFKKEFCSVQIKSIHKKQVPSEKIFENETGSIVIDFISTKEAKLDKNMVLVSTDLLDNFTDVITINITDDTCDFITLGSQYVAYFGNNIEAILVREIKKDKDMWKIKCHFYKDDIVRYVEPNSFVILRKDYKLIIGKVE